MSGDDVSVKCGYKVTDGFECFNSYCRCFCYVKTISYSNITKFFNTIKILMDRLTIKDVLLGSSVKW